MSEESTVRRVLADEGLILPGPPPREPRTRTPWPDWLEGKPNGVWAYDFTHFTATRRAALAWCPASGSSPWSVPRSPRSAAYHAHPERFVRQPPQPPALPTSS
jgi:hypothetical protein